MTERGLVNRNEIASLLLRRRLAMTEGVRDCFVESLLAMTEGGRLAIETKLPRLNANASMPNDRMCKPSQ
jgi:hypothetical protein